MRAHGRRARGPDADSEPRIRARFDALTRAGMDWDGAVYMLGHPSRVSPLLERSLLAEPTKPKALFWTRGQAIRSPDSSPRLRRYDKEQLRGTSHPNPAGTAGEAGPTGTAGCASVARF